MAEAAIVVENLEKIFPLAESGWRFFLHPVARPTERALAGISLEIQQGEAVALVGPNGAGKSTLLRILATLLVPTRGRALVGGYDTQKESALVRMQVGYHTGGDEGFYTRLTGRENLIFFAAMNNLTGSAAHEKIDLAAKWMHLGAELGRPVRTLSTGMTHRLGLMRALLHEPAVLLLDEPTRSLDPLSAADFRKLLREDIVERRKKTLLFSSHSLEEVECLASRVVLLEEGRLVAYGSPRDLQWKANATTFSGAVGNLLRHPFQRGLLP